MDVSNFEIEVLYELKADIYSTNRFYPSDFTSQYVALDFYYKKSHFPAFNVADSAITVGAALMIIDMIIELKNKRTAGTVTH